MNVLLIGPVAEPKAFNGIQTVNRLLASILDEEHNLDVAIPVNQLFTGKIRTRKVKDLTGAGTFGVDWSKPLSFAPYDMLALSGSDVPYKRIIRAFPGDILIWVHGVHLSPLHQLSGKEKSRQNIRIVCCDAVSLDHAKAMGWEDRAFLLENPVPFETDEVVAGEGYGIIVSSLSKRKNFPAMIEAAKRCAPGVPVRVYGQVKDESILQLIGESGQLQYCGTLEHKELMQVLSKASFMIHMACVEGYPSVAVREANGLGVPVILPKNPLYEASASDQNIFVDVNDLQPVDITAAAALKNRKKLAKQTREKYGLEAFRKALFSIVDGAG